MKKVEEFNRRQESLEKRKLEKQMEMRRTMTDKVLTIKKKDEIVIKHKTQYEMLKEEQDKKLNNRIENLQERVEIKNK
jgi:glycyl-tRNA synthetase beta subunit